MEVHELWELTNFQEDYLNDAIRVLIDLRRVLNHNAGQQKKQPVSEILDTALNQFRNIPLEELTHNQTSWLIEFECLKHLGESGAKQLESVIRTSDFDPVTALENVDKILADLNKCQSHLAQIRSPLSELPWVVQHPLLGRTEVEIRVIFQQDVSIENSADLKKRTADWYDIIRGVTAAVGETPEDVQVKGVGNGSILVWLFATASTTLILAKISKHVSGIALDGLKVASALEDLRQKKMLTEDIERQLKKNHEDDVKTKRLALAKRLPAEVGLELSEENTRLFEISIKKMLSFFQKGGELEFVEPVDDEDADQDTSADNDLRNTLTEIREQKRDTLLLTADVRLD